jgi:hypothetical protein
MSASLRIVIVNWNAGCFLRDCLDSVVAAQHPDVLIERTVVVDNASSDGSVAAVDGLRLVVDVLRNPDNRGFAAACNQGAAGSAADYLLFLNPDTRLLPDTLATVVRFMESEAAADVGICGVDVVGPNGRATAACARFPSLRTFFGQMTGLQHVAPALFPQHHLREAELASSRAVDQVIGAFFLVRRELFERLGGFDTRFFLYFEEVDLSLRARQKGARSYYLREAKVVHVGNVSSNRAREVRLYHSLRSRLLFAYQHWGRTRASTLALLTMTLELGARLGQAAVGRGTYDPESVVRAYRALLRQLPRLVHEDRRVSEVGQP